MSEEKKLAPAIVLFNFSKHAPPPPPPTFSGSSIDINEVHVHSVVVSRTQWKPFWLATKVCPQNDWAGWHIRVKYGVRTQTTLRNVSCTSDYHLFCKEPKDRLKELDSSLCPVTMMNSWQPLCPVTMMNSWQPLCPVTMMNSWQPLAGLP